MKVLKLIFFIHSVESKNWKSILGSKTLIITKNSNLRDDFSKGPN